MKVAESVLDLVGETPLVKIRKLNPNKNVTIYAKLEWYNPMGSVKDRIALKMIENAEKRRELTKDKIILEPTSGNTGIGLAMVAAVKGYKCIFVMPASVSIERMILLKTLGADIMLTPPEEGMDGAIKRAREMAKDSKYFMPNQFDNLDNVRAHYETTGPEIWKQTKGKITHFIAGMGTSGTLMGAGRYLKEKNPKIQIIGVEPEPNHKIQGLKNMSEAIVPKIYDESKLDRKIVVTTEQAYETARQLIRKEGLFVGMSAGAAMYAAIQVAKEVDTGVLVVIFPDHGFKYLSTPLCMSDEILKTLRELSKAFKILETGLFKPVRAV